MKVAVLGAGISGLTTAWKLAKNGVEVVVFEAEDRVGGAIGSFSEGGFLAESGPHTFLNSQADFDELISDLGLESARIWASETAKKRFTVKSGRPVALPMSMGDFIRTDLYSAASKLNLMGESFVPRRDDEIDESVTSFVKRRLGEDFLNYGVDLLVNGIWAGDPNRLSMRHAFKKIWVLEADHGSMMKGGYAKSKNKNRRPDASRIFSFKNGNQELVDALKERLDVRLSTPALGIAPKKTGWEVTTRSGNTKTVDHFDAVVSCVSSDAFAKIFPAQDSQRIAERLYHPPVAVMTFGFRRKDVSHPLDGVGMLLPEVEKRQILGVMFSSTLFENRAPADHVTMAIFVGGARHEGNARLPQHERRALVLKELRELLGVSGEPVFEHEHLWAKAIPQYEVGHGDVLVWAQSIERKNPGLYVSGNFRNAVAVPDLISSAMRLADSISKGN